MPTARKRPARPRVARPDRKTHAGIKFIRNSLSSTRKMRADARRRGDVKAVKQHTADLDILNKQFLRENNRVLGRKKGKV